MSGDRLLTISTFGRAVGLPPSALRHYAGAGVLEPAEVDPASGYRFYAPAQLRHGLLAARLRAAGVPLGVVRQTLRVPAEQAVLLLEQLAGDLAAQSEERVRILRSVVADLRAATDGHVAAVRVAGPVVARALEQVLLTVPTAAGDVAGVVWEVTGSGLAVAATDRYWLVRHEVPVPSSGGPVSTFTEADEAERAARTLSRQPVVEVAVTARRVHVRIPGGTMLAELGGGERAVPDLGLLIAGQPARRAWAGFPREALLRLLTDLDPDGPAHLRISGDSAWCGPADAQAEGWGSTSRTEPLQMLVRPSLLAAAVRACVGQEILVAAADPADPLVVSSPDQPQMTCLVMPMRP